MSLARTFPGIMVVNFSILSGYAMCGIPGAWAAFGVCAFTSVPKSVTILAGAAIGFVIQRRGIPGAICATLGTMMPSLTLCLAAACFIRRFRDHAGLNQLLRGIRPVCLGMLLAIAFTMGESVLWSG